MCVYIYICQKKIILPKSYVGKRRKRADHDGVVEEYNLCGVEDVEDYVKQRFGKDFVTEILRGLFKIQPAEMFCLQDFVSTGFLNLPFCVLKDCAGFFEAWKKEGR